MRKKLIATTILSAFLCTFSLAPAALAADTVQVTLPDFTVTLNGQSTSNDYSKYPLLVYKDITYFPMTYYDCRLLGIKTDWTTDTGLVIDKNEDYFYEYMREVNDNKNARKQTAKIADEKITVNGKVIDNSKEEYPLLVFRDVTYFPLTWRFAVNELGWQYRFNQQEGLVIDNDKVKLENPDAWICAEDAWAGGMGKYGDFTVSGIAYNETLAKHSADGRSADSNYIGFYNVTGQNTYVKELKPFKYCVSKKINGYEELLYWKMTPSFQGKFDAFRFLQYDLATNFWLNAPNGTYIAELQIPQYCIYQNLTTNEWLEGDIQGYYMHTKGTITLID